MTEITRYTAVLLLAALLLPDMLFAQDDSEQETPKPAATTTETPAETTAETPPATTDEPAEDPVKEFQRHTARRREIYGTLRRMQKQFEDAKTREEKLKVRDEYRKLIEEFEIEILQRMVELAPTVYEQEPENMEAAEFVLKDVFNRHLFDQAATVADTLIANDVETRDVLSMAGMSHFALHNFEKAKAIFTEAKERNRLNIQYERYQDVTDEYIELWKTEQAIREKEAALEGDEALPQVQFETTGGIIKFELFEDQAPNTVASFISLVDGKKYDGVKFHRVLDMFMAQGGDPNSLDDNPDNDGEGGPGYTIKCECFREDARKHFRGSLSMANTGTPDTGGSQFFITHLPTSWLNAITEPTKTGHTVFGRVIEGMDIAAQIRKGDVIKSATVLRKRPHEYTPVTTPDEETTPATNE